MAGNKSKSLGKLSRVELRDYWDDEARDFTPWLADQENLDLLSDTIGMELELVGREQSVGGFKVDILAKDTVTNRYVVIENQLEKTNHGHLGQLVTYASGYEAIAVVWIAKHVCEEHRKALDWLNEKTGDDLAFFGLEVELWKIGESKPAPKFNLVSQPNDWARAVNPGGSGNSELSERSILQHEFWQAFVEHMEEAGTFLNLRKPRPQHWYEIGVGRSNFHLSLTINSQTKRLGCELYISGRKAKIAFSQLHNQKIEIENELGTTLEWKELPHRNASRIVQFEAGDYEDKSTWPQLFYWFKGRAELFHKIFSSRVADLDLENEEAA